MNEPESLQQAGQILDGNLFLIGFMGAGKSTVAQALSALYGMEVIEMDGEIERRAGRSISDIFSTLGEEAFRQMETELITTLEPGKRLVVSCGGGTAMREVNVQAMRRSGSIVWLTATPETILARVADSGSRPLLEGHKDLAYIQTMLRQRQPKYEAAADIAVATDGKDAAQICGDILAALKARRQGREQEG
ncbi:MAG: shikimate kinase [Clostridiales bacterium]|nr:shikimate kinase [Clostridiales bacterium]MCD8366670.1 shikimate kinase [Clostridiales bacterium]